MAHRLPCLYYQETERLSLSSGPKQEQALDLGWNAPALSRYNGVTRMQWFPLCKAEPDNISFILERIFHGIREGCIQGVFRGVYR